MRLTKNCCVGVLWCLALSLMLTGCRRSARAIVQKIVSPYTTKRSLAAFTDPIPNPPITIWIHGTRFIRKFNTTSNPQLTLAADLPTHAYAYQIAHMLAEAAPTEFPLEGFYGFEWSGGISNQDRITAAHALYTALRALVAQHRTRWNSYPVIRIISHSHGGNVALNMVNIQEKERPVDPLSIESLIMLACPVQNNTMHLTQNTMFQAIYSLYSSLDMVQVIAPQKFYGILPFSYRKFPKHPTIIQAKVRMNGHSVFHTEFTSKRFFKILPIIFDQLRMLSKTVTDDLKKQHILLRINTRGQNIRSYKGKKIELALTQNQAPPQ